LEEQYGVLPEHCELLVQPTQYPASVRQYGCPVPPSPKATEAHSLSLVHDPQSPVEALQKLPNAGAQMLPASTVHEVWQTPGGETLLQTSPPEQSLVDPHPQ
jgi:hypothetical protein